MGRLLRRLAETWRRAVDALRSAARFVHRWATLRREMERGDGVARPPSLVQIKVTNRCNMRCKMCGQWGETGFHKHHEGRQTIDLDLARSFVDQIAPRHTDLTLWGGEPLIYPHLAELLEHCQRRRVPTGIITNGLTLADHAEMLVRTGVKDVVVSLDAPPAIHDELRGVDGAFDRVVEGLRELERQRRRAWLARPRVAVSSVVSEHTWPHIEELVDHLAALEGVRIGHLVATLRWWTDRATGEAYEREMIENLGCAAAPSWTGFEVTPPLDIDTAAVAAALDRIRRKRTPFRVLVHPRLTARQIDVFFRNTTISFGLNTCRGAWVYALLLPSGELTFCPDFPDYRFGSLSEAPFDALWNGEPARRFRKRMLRGLLPICPRCCGMYTTGTPWRPTRRPAEPEATDHV